MKKLAILLNSIAFALILIVDILYIIFGDLWLKGTASGLFVLLGIINLIFALKLKTDKRSFCILILIGLVFAMLGDIILNIHFISGAVLFAIGHIFFFASYCALTKFSWKDLIYTAIIFVVAVCIITLVPIFDFGGIVMELVCIFYALVISCMLGKAISNFISTKSILALVILIGSALFFFSDLMLLFNKFGGVGNWAGFLCLITYYPAEFVLALSILFATTIFALNKNNDVKNKN